jgi:hypothetical protein
MSAAGPQNLYITTGYVTLDFWNTRCSGDSNVIIHASGQTRSFNISLFKLRWAGESEQEVPIEVAVLQSDLPVHSCLMDHVTDCQTISISALVILRHHHSQGKLSFQHDMFRFIALDTITHSVKSVPLQTSSIKCRYITLGTVRDWVIPKTVKSQVRNWTTFMRDFFKV